MSMTVLLELTLRPDAEGAHDVIRDTLAVTRAFDGNEGLEVLVDDADPNKLVIVELWASPAHNDAYIAWRATPEGRSSLGTIVAAPPVKRAFSSTIPLNEG